MNPLIEYYNEYTAKDYVFSGTDKEIDRAVELAAAATQEQTDEFSEYLKVNIAGESYNERE